VIALLALLLAVELDEPGPVRLASAGTPTPVVWLQDGREVARTSDGDAATIALPAGRVELWAKNPTRGAWMAVARPEPSGDGFAYTPAVVAHAPPQPPAATWTQWAPAAAALALALLAVPRKDRPRGLRPAGRRLAPRLPWRS